ncbi:MAG TPA: cytochrome c peroxidase [Gemmatimonadaceae bacterium]|jgi:cytochrome c peroxidase
MSMTWAWRAAVTAAVVVPLAVARVRHEAATPAPVAADADVAALGKKIFFDSSLSGSGRMACASCHSPDHAYAPPNDRAVQLGGASMAMEGTRAVPSLRYVLNRTPAYYKSFALNVEERARDGSEPPAGGFGWDGRFNSLHDQAAFPLLAANEMGNASRTAVVNRVRQGMYADVFRRAYGEKIFDDTVSAFAKIVYSVERFELTDASFHPYDSKYDLYLDGKIALSGAEKRGLALFVDGQRGGCAACHLAAKGADGTHPLFTDYQFGALGVPRNPEIAANRNSAYFDKGLCGPTRVDQQQNRDLCGMFKTPTLRNVATRGTFFHNGRFHSLKDALRFYVRCDTDPRLWYPKRAGKIEKFDDLPSSLRDNVDVASEPLTKHAGEKPAWSDAEIDDVIAFLNTLTDGYRAK